MHQQDSAERLTSLYKSMRSSKGNKKYFDYFEKNIQKVLDYNVRLSSISDIISSDLMGNITIDIMPFHTSVYC
jgi:methyl coenzyme M reductase subunit C-like uncharacterized protein (methanogenesis marker protein 7)